MYKTLHIFANAALGKGLSGGDRIFIEFSKRLGKDVKVIIHVWREGYEICKREGIINAEFKIMNVDNWCRYGFFICYLSRIVKSIWYALSVKIQNHEQTALYSASEFWMDSLPGFILKCRYPKITWVAAWFQTAPNPLTGFSQGKRENAYHLSALYYWIMQLPIKPLIENFADFVLVNNEFEKKNFPRLNNNKKAIVILGAVNVEEIQNWLSQNDNKNLPKIYDAVFQGRFHPQKGVIELIEIWKIVIRKIPQAKLVLIGDGPLMGNVKRTIKDLNLENNIKLFGYVFDGDKKYKIFAQSKIVVHPAFYDSGGMAASEAMAFGLPCVGFNLDSYNSYYPKGMIKTKIGNMQEFADAIVKLITNKKLRIRIGSEAQKMILENWSWDQRTSQLINILK